MTTDYKKTQKNTTQFLCDTCNFNCFKISDYKRHLMTAKHKRMTMDDEKTPKSDKTYDYVCECGNIYKYRQGLHKHKKRCSVVRNTNLTLETQEQSSLINLISQNKEIMDALILQNEQLMKQNKEQSDTIKELIPKIGNNNNTINNQFNIQNFLNEDCKDALNFSDFIKQIQISFEDLENQAQIGFVKGISKLFIDNLQELGTHKRPIHCTDKKRKTLYIKENNEWDKEDAQNTLKKGIRDVSMKTMECLSQEKEENQEEYNDIESDFSQKYLLIKRNLLPGFPQDTTINKVIEQISSNSGIIE